ncbi:MAG TPA: hypothetical protein VJT32_04205 [bacterium]|nr:hypothetical protein [bacterium]
MADPYGKVSPVDEEYETPDEYSGDDRMIKNLSFLYEVAVEQPDGTQRIEAREAKHGDVVTLEQMGEIARQKGEQSGAFYTDEERERIEAGGSPDAPAGGAGGDVSSLGEYELAEYIKSNNLTVGDTVALAGSDKDLAHRVLQAENIATDGEPRKGVETGLTAIIES